MNPIEESFTQSTDKILRLLSEFIAQTQSDHANISSREEVVSENIQQANKKLSDMQFSVEEMRSQRDVALQEAQSARRLLDLANKEREEAQSLMDEATMKLQEVEERELKLKKDVRFKKNDIKVLGDMGVELDKLRESLKIKEEFIKKEQALLYDKQKSLEDREDKIMKDEQRLKVYRDRK